MARVLISGGNGFLGSFLTDFLVSNGTSVTVVDDLSTSKRRQVSDKAKFIKMKIEKFKTKEKFDFVIHLAARPSPEDYIQNPLATINSNDLGTRVMLEIARKSDAVFMYTSTSEVYGDPSILPIPETYFGYVNPNGVRSCYDESKRFSESLIKAYERQYGLDIRIQRPFNVYGPRIREDGFYGRVIPRFIDQAIKNDSITIHGDGKQTRSFLYVEDWLSATSKILTSPKAKGEIFNVGNNNEISINKLAKIILSQTKSKSDIVHIKPREEDPRRRAADIRKIKRILGWEPKVSLEDGLKRTIDWFISKNSL